jgi:alpha-1,3-rhamnosyl/mannosyltransferase
MEHPEWHPVDRVRWYEREFEAGLGQSVRLIAASEYTKRRVVETLGYPAERIDVTYHAARADFAAQSREEAAATLERVGVEPGYFLFVGTLEPRKNITTLLSAYARLPRSVREAHPLLIVGAWGWRQAQLREDLRRRDIASHVRMTGYLADRELAALYSHCAAFVWPTLYEGFGLPPLEAMQCGAAVVVSRETSLPEVVGDAGPLLSPDDVEGWADAMRRMAEDETWRARCRERSAERARTFTWRRCVEQTADCYRRAMAACG